MNYTGREGTDTKEKQEKRKEKKQKMGIGTQAILTPGIYVRHKISGMT